jgi:hypothetical protein
MRPMTMGEARLDTAKLRLQRLGAVNGCFRCSPAAAEHDLPLPKAPEAAIIARNSPGIGGMSAEGQGDNHLGFAATNLPGNLCT